MHPPLPPEGPLRVGRGRVPLPEATALSWPNGCSRAGCQWPLFPVPLRPGGLSKGFPTQLPLGTPSFVVSPNPVCALADRSFIELSPGRVSPFPAGTPDRKGITYQVLSTELCGLAPYPRYFLLL